MKIVVLSSGGVDSSVVMCLLKNDGHDVFPLFINYGQLALEKEWKSCTTICNHLNLKPTRVDVEGFGKKIKSGITNQNLDIKKDAFLPNRNLFFLTIASAYAFDNSISSVSIGILANPIFPDQTVDFIQSAERCINSSLNTTIKIIAPLISLDKIDTLRLAKKYGLPLESMSYCHSSNDVPCGSCISCNERILAEKWMASNE